MNRGGKRQSSNLVAGPVGSVSDPEDKADEAWDHEGYMVAKRAKLHQQLNKSIDNGSGSLIFAGVTIHINGLVNPTNLRLLFIQHGGHYDPFPSSSTDFVIASNLADATKRKWGKIAVKPEWVMESIAAGQKLDHKKYFLYDFNEEKKQKTLTQALKLSSYNKSESGLVDNHANPRTTNPPFNGELVDFVDKTNTENHGRSRDTANVSAAGLPEVPKNLASENLPSCVSPSKTTRLQAWEDGFLEEFWDHSRLHYISTMKKTLQTHISRLRRNLKDAVFPDLLLYRQYVVENTSGGVGVPYSGSSVLFLVDLDCFFVAVGRLSRPSMINKPVAVTHSVSKKLTSNADIACASYEARQFGVRNGMWISEAKVMCPELEVIPYDFEAYQRVSMEFCNTVAGFTLDIEPGSCDELLVDVTSILAAVPGANPTNLADFMRRRILEETKCNASIGIGTNRLLAKLASKKAKPNGVYTINESNIAEIVKTQPVRNLYGVGYSLCEKLERDFNVQTCEDLQAIRMDVLQKSFGVKKGSMLYNACRGIDAQTLAFDFERPKSVSIDVNYGIRLTEASQAEKLVSNIAKALSKRAEECEARGTKLQVTLLARMKNAPEPSKMGGHGHVDNYNKTLALLNPTRSAEIFNRSILTLLRKINVPAEDYRGIGVHLTGLKFDYDGKKQVQKTLELSKVESKIAEQGSSPFNRAQRKLTEFHLTGRSGLPAVAEQGPSTSVSSTNTTNEYRTSEEILEPVWNQMDEEDVDNSDSGDNLSESFLEALPSQLREEVVADFYHVKALKKKVGKSIPAKPVAAKEKFVRDSNTDLSDKDTRNTLHKTAATARSANSTNQSLINANVDDTKTSVSHESTSTLLRVVQQLPGEDASKIPWNRVNWWHYNHKDKLPSSSKTNGFTVVDSSRTPTSLSDPILNGRTSISEVRNLIRQIARSVSNPTKSDLSGLFDYIEDLLANHWYKHIQLLLVFLKRLSDDGSVSPKWSKIFAALIDISQAKIKRRLGYHIQLTDFEDESLS